ncbi:MAG: hypothetical protein EOO38_22530 [Cytophagaceae bacterium]|nr:MAG: hypothetical protein EOO38_22530 [Cytophagaceae bacterium]
MPTHQSPTHDPHAPLSGSITTVLFDMQCTVCRVLSQVVSEETLPNWRFLAWQDYKAPAHAPDSWREVIPSELRVVTEDRFLEGEDAWRYLILHNPRLKKYQLLAAKVGLSAPRSARWLQAVGHGLRRLCVSCVYFRRS